MEEEKTMDKIFKDIRYYAVGNITETIKEKLLAGKAKPESYLSALATHAIVFNSNHYEAESAREVWQLPTISPNWVEWSHKCKICLPVEGFSALTTQLLSNIVVCFTQISKQDKQVLWALVNFYGGKCQSKLNKYVTHLVTLEDKGTKFNEAIKHSEVKIVAPDWILDSVKLKKLQDPVKYHPNLNVKKEISEDEKIKLAENEIQNNISVTLETSQNLPLTLPASQTQSTTTLVKSDVITTNIPVQPAANLMDTPQTQTNINLTANGQTAFNNQIQQQAQTSKYSLPMQVSYSMEQQQLQTTRFSLANQPLRQPMTSTTHMMSPGNQQFAMMSSGHQQMMMMSPPPRATSASPRRNSGSQTPGKKRKNSQSNRTPQVSHTYPPNHPAMFQQQMMLRQRLPIDSSQPRMQLNPDSKTGPRTPGRFPKPAENFQQQIMGQHMGGGMIQTSPRGPQPVGMDQKWQKAPGFENQPMFHPQQANMGQGHMIRQPGMGQVRGHPPFNPHMMLNRFPMQINQPQMTQPRGNSPQQQQQIMMTQKGRFPTSTSLAAAGMEGISPVALQQGLIKAAQMQADQPALIHPSLQGTLFPKVPLSAQGGGGNPQKKRTKSRKKNENLDEDQKPKGKPRAKNKKPQDQLVTPIPNQMLQAQINHANMAQGQFQIQGGMIIGGQMPNDQLQQQQQIMLQNMMPNTPMAMMAQAQQQQQPQQQSKIVSNFQPSISEYIQQPPTTVASNDLIKKTSDESKQESPGRINRSCDPLYLSFPTTNEQYFGRNPSEKVSTDLFLLGCVFCIFQYDEVLQDISVMDLWKKMIQKFGGVVENTCTSLCTHVICISRNTPLVKQAIVNRKRCVTVYWLNDVLQLRKLRPPWLAIHLPTWFSHLNKPLKNQVFSYTGFHHKERERVKMMAFMCGAKITSFFGRNNDALLFKDVSSTKYMKAQEWVIPCVTINWLRDIMQSDSNNLPEVTSEKYKNLGTNLMDGFLLDIQKSKDVLEPWKIPITVTAESLLKSKIKRKYEDNALHSTTSSAKRPKYQPSPRICFTGLHPAAVLGLTKKVASLNSQVEETLTLCTHLVAQKVSRTIKFLSCISSCSHVVTPDWIDESERNKTWLDESRFLLLDKEAEEKFDFSLKESVKRARKKQLFKDCLFAITPSVVPDRGTLKQILECAGGRLLSKIPAVQVLKHIETRNENRILIISCPEDDTIYNSYKKEGLSVHNSEIILTGVLKQQINTEIYRL